MTLLVVLKAITATIYTNFETEIIDDSGPGSMEQEDSFLAGPIGEPTLRFRAVNPEMCQL